MPRRSKTSSYARMYMHDVRVAGFIVSTTCEGPECTVCAGDPAAAKRAENPHFPYEPVAVEPEE